MSEQIEIKLKPISGVSLFVLRLWGYTAVAVLALFALSFVVMTLSVFYHMIF